MNGRTFNNKWNNKLFNQYAASFNDLYSKTPKAVLAALVYILMERLEMSDKSAELVAEWEALHAAGIVPQTPPKREVTR